ncbi:MAG TPA: TRAP transporter substrate-binding protein [Saprospiraceae bacterium]|nr:TRAP transporter substrate-binding protein [Saprospiraceae bacterium]
MTDRRQIKTTTLTRQHFVRLFGAAAIGGTMGLASCKTAGHEDELNDPSPRQQEFRWNMVTTWAPNSPVQGEGCNKFAKWIEQMSAGQLTIKVYGGGELIPALEAFDAVSSGTAEIGSGASYYWAGKSAATQFFASIPFGLNAQQMNAWLTSGGGMALWEEVYAPFNLLPLIAGNTGMQMGGWFNREINTIDDLRGLKMRIPGLGGNVLNRAGGTAVLTAGAEIYTNLERGVIDATEWIGPYHDYLMGFHQIAKYYYYPGWQEPGTVLEIFVNKLKFERLPIHLQEIIRAASSRLNAWMLSEMEVRNAEYLAKIRAETKVEIRAFPPEVLSRLREISAQVIEELAASDPLSRKVYDAVTTFKGKINLWADVSERVFYNSF